MTEEHPFAQYVRILGKGRQGSRALSQQEAHAAMRMILAGEVEDIQLGAFLMLVRAKEEAPEELAGFVQAVKESLTLPPGNPEVALDWSSYAGKRRQLPWFLLSALLLAANGVKVFMHGTEGRQDDRIYTPEVLALLGIPESPSLADASARIRERGFAFMTLQNLNPVLHKIMGLRPLLGLRSPVHTVARMINPFNAPALLQGIFHPGYRDTHQQAALLLGQPHMAVFKGEGGEIERNPDAACLVQSVHDGIMSTEEWPALFNGPRHLKDETMDPRRLAALWRGEIEEEYGAATVIGTAAIALKTAGMAKTLQSAEELAAELWNNRIAARLDAA
ncbi:MAG: glycosyl transferase family protein [Burkholderiales bacterium]